MGKNLLCGIITQNFICISSTTQLKTPQWYAAQMSPEAAHSPNSVLKMTKSRLRTRLRLCSDSKTGAYFN